MEDLQLDGFDTVVAGEPLAQNASSELTRSELPRLLGLSLALITVVLALVYRRFSEVAIGLVGLTAAIALTYGFGSLVGPGWLGWTGPFNQITTVVPILVVGLGIDFALHLTMRQREERRETEPRRASRTAIVTVGGALTLTTVTTAIGFLTNLFTPLPPIRDFGVFTAIGVAATFAAMMVLVPASRTLLDRRSGSDAPAGDDAQESTGDEAGDETVDETGDEAGNAPVPFVGAVARFSTGHPVVVLVVAGLISIAALFAGLSVPTTFSTDDFIPSGSDAAEALAATEDVFGSEVSERTYVLMEGDLGQLAAGRATDALADVPGVREGAGEPLVEGPTQLLGEVSAASPEASERLASLGWTSQEGFAADADVPAIWEAAQQAEPRRASRAFESGGDRQLLTIQTSAGQDGAEQLVDRIGERLEPLADAGVDLRFTGQQLIFARTVDALKSSQLRSIGITVGAALGLLVGYFWWRDRSAVLGLVAMVPTVLAATWVVGTMWLADLSFNVLTITIGSLAIAIGVDYGIHITYRFREEYRQRDTGDAIVHTIRETGGALAGSAATTAVGFGVLVLSSVLPIRQFGIITALTIVYSMIAAVVVMPAILRVVEGDDRDRRHDSSTAR